MIKKMIEIEAKNKFDFALLMIKDNNFIDLDIVELDEEINVEYNIESLFTFDDFCKLNKRDIYRGLANLAQLDNLSHKYYFSLSPDNLYFDQNLTPKILWRDVYSDNQPYQAEFFVAQYKSAIGLALNSKYKFTDYLNGGQGLLSKDKELAKFEEVGTVVGIEKLLFETYEDYKVTYISNTTEVNTKKYKMFKIILAGVAAICIALAGFAGYQHFVVQKKNNIRYQASANYINKDYHDVVEILDGLSYKDFDSNSKMIYAISLINSSERIKDYQKPVFLNSLSLITDDRFYQFWYHVGHENVNETIELARQIGDDRYVVVSYVEKLAYLQKKVNRTVEEDAEIEDLKTKIEQLNAKYTEEDKNE